MDQFWLKAIGDESFTSREEAKRLRGELLGRLKAAVKSTLVAMDDESQVPMSHTLAVLAAVEACLAYGWKAQSWDWWSFFERGLGNVEVAREIVLFTSKTSQEQTGLGKGRMLLLNALKGKTLAYCLHQLQDNQALCAEFYQPHALWLSEEGVGLPAMIVSLNAVSFCIGPLNVSLDDKASVANVLEEIRGGTETEAWGPFGFIRNRKKKEKKKKSSKKSIVSLGSEIETADATLDDKFFVQDDDEAQAEDLEIETKEVETAGENENENENEKSDKDEISNSKDENLNLKEESLESNWNDSVEGPEEKAEKEAATLADILGPVEARVLPPASPRGFERALFWGSRGATGGSEVEDDERDNHSTEKRISMSPGMKDDSVAGSLFLMSPPLSQSAASVSVTSSSAEDRSMRPLRLLDLFVREEEREAEIAQMIDEPVSSTFEDEETESESESAFAAELRRLEEERKLLEEQQSALNKEPSSEGIGKEKEENSIRLPSSPAVIVMEQPMESSRRVFVVPGDGSDLFQIALQASGPQIVRFLPASGDQIDPRIFCDGQLRNSPLELLREPSPMTLSAQGGMCADCGRGLSSGARQCSLLGRWFCRRCHRDERAILPGRLLRLWDARPYRVCVFAKSEIDRSLRGVFYDLQDINPGLFRVSEKLMAVRNLRRQLVLLTGFVGPCSALPSEVRLPLRRRGMGHLAESATVFSLHDLKMVESGKLLLILREISVVLLRHVSECNLCAERRVACNSCQVLVFPFDVRKVARCNRCNRITHRKCMDQATNYCRKCR